MRAVFLAAATVAVVVLAGCGERDVPRGTVRGKITYRGQPLTGASVIFVDSGKKTHVLNIKPDGSYEVEGVALGPVKVSVQPDAPRSAVKGEFDPPPKSSESKGVTDEKSGKASSSAPQASKGKAPPQIPAHYADAEKSGLSFELKESGQDWSFDIK